MGFQLGFSPLFLWAAHTGNPPTNEEHCRVLIKLPTAQIHEIVNLFIYLHFGVSRIKLPIKALYLSDFLFTEVLWDATDGRRRVEVINYIIEGALLYLYAEVCSQVLDIP